MFLVMTLSACGGGGGDDPAPPPPPLAATALPDTLTLGIPASRQALGADVAFASNAVDPKIKLSYRWDFGDGSSSTLPSPSHKYAQNGAYAVSLKLSNEDGKSVQAAATVTVADLAVVQGRSCSGADSSGWCWRNPLPQGNPINDYAWLDAGRGWAVGDSGTLLKTTDGGSTWTTQNSGTDVALSQVSFISELVGWAMGANGLMLNTGDGGVTWRSASLGAGIGVQSFGAADANTAWVSGNDTVSVTNDGGASWKRISRPVNSSAKLVATGKSSVWTLGTSSTALTLLHTVDGGAKWVGVPVAPAPASGLYRSVNDFQFADDQHGLVSYSESGYEGGNYQNYVSRQVSLATVDGGASWRVIDPRPGVANGYQNALVITADGAIFARDYYSSAINISTDLGSTWRSLSVPQSSPNNTNNVASFTPYSASRMLLRGNDGKTYFTSDPGATWSAVRSANTGNTSPANSIWFFDSREGLALTDDGNSLRTTDGGQTWVPRNTDVINPHTGWQRMEFLPGKATGWVISTYGGGIFRSTDKGRTWLAPVPQTSANLGSISDFHFVDESYGWALSNNNNYYTATPTLLFSSTDGGSSWQAVPGSSDLVGMAAIRFADRSNGVAVGAAGVAMLTSDGGLTWRPRPTGGSRILRRVVFVDAQTALAVGDAGSILRSTDRGQNWSKVQSPTANNLTEVRFVSAKVGHAVGDLGTVLVTRDGGLSWSEVSVRSQSALRSVFFIDEFTGWSVGGGGAILATISGGR